jgi:small subunit ribosomal protein S16
MHWLSVGATPSDTARSILRKSGVWDKFEAGKKKAE